MIHVDFFRNPIKFFNSKTFLHNPSSRYISAEIEVNDIEDAPTGIHPVDTIVKKWSGSIVEDGSLNGDYSFEINTAPANGDMWIKQVQEITKVLNQHKAKVDESCGLHIHCNAKDFSIYDIYKLMLVYSKVEPALLQMVPLSRRHTGGTCKPVGMVYGHKINRKRSIPTYDQVFNHIYKLVYQNFDEEEGDQYKPIILKKKLTKYDCTDRYRALNVHSWAVHGTIECRLGAGTTNPTKIANWGMIIATLCDFAKYNTVKFIEGLPNPKNHQESLDLLLKIMPTIEIKNWIKERTELFLSKEEEKAQKKEAKLARQVNQQNQQVVQFDGV